jgi:hypothetical protein
MPAHIKLHKDSTEVVKFMRLFQKVRDWTDNDPESLPELAGKDDGVKALCLDLLRAAGSLQRNERRVRELFTAPVDPTFIAAWRDFEQRFADILLIVRSNDVEAGEAHFLSTDWYERPASWEDADDKAAWAVELIEEMVAFAEFEAPEDKDYTFNGKPVTEWHTINANALPRKLKADWIKFLAIHRAFEANIKQKEEEIRNELQSCDDETRKSELYSSLAEIRRIRRDEDEPASTAQVMKWAVAEWNRLRGECGFDLRGVFRRRFLVPFILFPRHVSARHGQTKMASIYQNLRQAHEAFVFGTPFAALALMRSIMEVVLRDHYGADGNDLHERIRNCRKLLPDAANEVALNRLRRTANSILHLDTGEDHALSELDTDKWEVEILSLLRVLRALVEGAPQLQSR